MKSEKRKQFFEQLRGKETITAPDIRNATAAAGDVTEIIQEILDYAAGMGIDVSAELADLTGAQEVAREAETIRQVAESLAEKSGALAAETDPEKRRELIKAIRRDADFLEPSTGNGFQLVRMDSLEVKPPSWLVKGLIETDSFGCLYGDPAAGKSFVGIELASCIATGTPFYGVPVKQGPVIFLAGEGQSGLVRRFRAWEIARGVSLTGKPLYINRGTVSLIDDTSMLHVIQALERLILEIGRPPALAILDTWSRVLGGDDSAPSDAQAGVAALDALRLRFENFAALVIHHEGHTKNRARGWSGLRAAVDVEMRAERGNDGVVRLECTKAKDTEPITPMAFHFSTVELGINDEEGNAVTSAVLSPATWTPAPEAVKKALGKNQALALDILKQLYTGNENITLDAWRKACKAARIERTALWHTIDSLKKSGLIQVDGEIVRCAGVALSVENRGLLYSPTVSTHVSTLAHPIENSTVSTLFNTFNAPELSQTGKSDP